MALEFPELLRRCGRPASRGAEIARLLQPERSDYCVLKPKHSGFYATPLATLLEHIGARELILTGIASPQCIMFTAMDAYVREYRLSIPSDCVVGLNTREQRYSCYFFRRILKAHVARGAALKL